MKELAVIIICFTLFLGAIPSLALLRQDPEEAVTYTEPDRQELCRVLLSQMPADYPEEALRAQLILIRTCMVRGDRVSTLSDEELESYYGEDLGEAWELAERLCGSEGRILTFEGEPVMACWHPWNGGKTQGMEGTAYLVSVDSPEAAPEGEITWECRGMSQLGAKEMAEGGASAGVILEHYFPGTEAL